MKKYLFGIFTLAVLTAGVIFVFAQKRAAGEERSFGGPHFPPPFMLEKIADEVGLSDEQKAQVKQILESEKPKIRSLTESLRETHQQLEKLGADGVYNEAQVAELAARQADTTRQLIVEKEKTKATIFAVLTPDQRTKAEQMRERFKGRFRGKFGGRFFGGEGPKEF